LPATPPPGPGFFARLGNWLSEINRDRVQVILLVAASLWVAYRLMIHFVHYLYEIDQIRHAARIVESAFLPFRRRNITIQKGVETSTQEISAREMVGGRSTLTLDADQGYAAVLERPGSYTRVVGPQDHYPVSLDGFTHLREIIDLRDQRLIVTLSGHTKDGIPIKANNWSFICRLAGSKTSAPQKLYVSCDPASVHNLVFRHWIGQDWINQSKRRKALVDLVSTALAEFISGRRLVEFLPELEQLQQAEAPASKQLRLIDQFVAYFERNVGEHGLQLVWTGRGAWQLAPEAAIEPILENSSQAYENWFRNHPEILSEAGSQKRMEETHRLVHHVVGLFDNMIAAQQSDDQILTALTQHYLDRIKDAIRVMEARGEKPAREWLEAARHLDRLV
jgi:hypothetical protein